MKLTYTGHSGVVLSWENCNWVIDYFKGDMPKLDKDKKLFVFASHTHGDHFNPEVFDFFRDFADVSYVLAFDIEKKVNENAKAYGLTEKQLASIRYVDAGAHYEFSADGGKTLTLDTFVSTDEGVAFLIGYDGKKIYHAGDLNWWAWDDNEPPYAKWMEETFLGEVKKIANTPVDLAFIPVDSRLEGNAYMGPDAFMRAVDAKIAYPIHMTGAYDITKKLREMDISAPYRERIKDFDFDGQVIEIAL